MEEEGREGGLKWCLGVGRGGGGERGRVKVLLSNILECRLGNLNFRWYPTTMKLKTRTLFHCSWLVLENTGHSPFSLHWHPPITATLNIT